ncbi:MAG: hypothetical protein JO152_15865 [Mycobacteriaceae bacterium]|nr:hypothetical protein [Mycobacteriaceae bacterium]
MKRLCAPLSSVLTAELDGAQHYLGVPTEEILLAALGRTIARTIGEGVVAVDVAGHGRSVGWFSTSYPVPVTCVCAEKLSATQMLGDVHRTLSALPQPRPAYVTPTQAKPSDIYFSYTPTTAEPSERHVEADPPILGHALELRVYRAAGLLHMDWWYDIRKFTDSTVEEFTEQFPLALIELTSEAYPPADDHADMAMASAAG